MNRFKALANKFIWEDEDTRIEGARYLFFFITFAFGLCFTFLSSWSGADQTQLYQTSQLHLFDGVTNIWGGLCLWVGGFIVLNHITRWATLGSWTAFLGAALWSYAALVYLFDHFWFGLIVAALPNLVFWTFFYLRATRYHRIHDWE